MTSPSEPLTGTPGLDPAGPPVLDPPVLDAPVLDPAGPSDPAGRSDQVGPSDPVGPPGPAGPEGKRRGRGRRLVTLVLLIVVGIAGVAGGGFTLAHELTRHATKSEIAAASAQEIASRWRRLPAGKIFPATIGYQNAESDSVVAHLVGIAPLTSCRSAMSAAAFARIRPAGCSTVLRATYVDASGTLAATVGVAVMASQTAATDALAQLGTMTSGVSLNAVPFNGTVTNTFGNAQRAAGAIQEIGGPYLFLFSAGYTDGLPASAAKSSPELVPLGSGLLTALESKLTAATNPCAMKDIRC